MKAVESMTLCVGVIMVLSGLTFINSSFIQTHQSNFNALKCLSTSQKPMLMLNYLCSQFKPSTTNNIYQLLRETTLTPMSNQACYC